jgi:transcriptional regulator EpsA
MSFLSTLDPEENKRYLHIVTEVLKLRTHLDVFMWLRGDVQYFMPHDILVAAWGDFDSGSLQFDLISALPGVRTSTTSTTALVPLLRGLFRRWVGTERRPFALNVGEVGFLLPEQHQGDDIAKALGGMRVALVHGINSQRDRNDCLYAMFSRSSQHEVTSRRAIDVMLPYIDTALRRVEHLPPQRAAPRQELAPARVLNIRDKTAESIIVRQHGGGMSNREMQIMQWVEQGKTNSEIGTILEISAYTVKNHLQRIFKKLDVYNRAQAVSRFKDSNVNG